MIPNLSKIIKSDLIQIIFFLFFLIQFFFTPYEYQKWLTLLILGLSLSLLSFFYTKKLVLPSKNWLLFVGAVLLINGLSSIMNGSFLLEERWINRYSIILVALGCLQFFSDSKKIESLKWPLVFFLSLIVCESFYQYLFLYTPSAKLALSTFASRFYNIAYLSQALLLSLPLLSFYTDQSKNKKEKYILYFLIFISITLIILSQTRTTWIGLAIFVALEFIKNKFFQKKTILLILGFSLIIALGLQNYKKVYIENTQEVSTTHKNVSSDFRLKVYQKSLLMAKDIPTGVGPSNFSFYLFLYLNKDKIADKITDLYKTPHSEPLQVLTEDGLGIFLIYLTTLLFFIFTACKNYFFEPTASKTSHLTSLFFLCLIPEISFHFPFDLFFPVFIFSVMFSLMLAEGKNIISIKPSIKLQVVLTIAFLFTIGVFYIREVKIIPNSYSEKYCQIFHDNSQMCQRYFAEHYILNEFEQANKIPAAVLKYQPLNFFMLSADYSLATEPRSQIAACLYYNVFSGQYSIKDSPVDKCQLISDPLKKFEVFQEYSQKRSK